ncbi:MAG: zf-HC2 domain-containing protein [Acidiferrobacterales bacterium]
MSDHHHEHDTDEIDCLEAIDSLYAYLDGELKDEDSIRKFKQHLAHCRSCYSRSELESELNQRIKSSGKKATPDSLNNRLRKLIDDF